MLSKISLKLHKHRGSYWREKTPLTIFKKSSKSREICLQRKLVMTSFRRYDNSDVIVTLLIANFYLYLIQPWWSFFQIFANDDLQVLTLKTSIEPPRLPFAWLISPVVLHTLINMAKGVMTSGCDSTRSDNTSNEASASAAYPLPMWVTSVPTISCSQNKWDECLVIVCNYQVNIKTRFASIYWAPKSHTQFINHNIRISI